VKVYIQFPFDILNKHPKESPFVTFIKITKDLVRFDEKRKKNDSNAFESKEKFRM
jgi:hypothetical protein